MEDALKFRFEVFGGRETASSRLRAWKVGDELKERGHKVEVGGRPAGETDVDVWIFQKRRDSEALKRAQAAGATVVFDFDDNYLLKDVGTRYEVLAFMNVADLVTVGSPTLLEESRRLHEQSFLFENPIDVRDEGLCKEECEWRGRLAWFGNRTNLPALDDVCRARGVTTITNGGDVEWSLETVDDELLRFDLALLPVLSTEWRNAKNANRLLKCIALGLPALVSCTPEHMRVAEAIELPRCLLVEEGESWEERVQLVEQRYEEIQKEILDARQKVLGIWGIRATVDRWLTRIMDAHGRASSSSRVSPPNPAKVDGPKKREFGALDVVILVDGRTESWGKTLRSVRDHCQARGVSVVGMGVADEADAARQGASCYFCSDPFRMYEVLSEVVWRGEGDSVLLLRGGAELRPGFADEVGSSCDGSQIALFAVQQTGRGGEVVTPPQTVQDVLGETYTPPCVLLPKGVFKNVNGPLSRYGALMAWFSVIWGVEQWGYGIRTVDAPVVMAPREAMSAQPVERFWEVLSAADSESAKEVPKAEDEWRRLLWVWRAAVIEDCKDAYKDHAATVIPMFLGERDEREREHGGTARRAPCSDKGRKIPASDNERMYIRKRAIRGGWRCVRYAVPPGLREKLFQRYKWTYYRYFPERQIRQSG